MTSIRKAAVAGTFYPNDASELQACLDTLMHQTDVDIKHPPLRHLSIGVLLSQLYLSIEWYC